MNYRSPWQGVLCSQIMRLIIVLCVVTVAYGKVQLVNIAPKCDGLEVRGVFHRNEVLAKGLNRPYQLSHHHKNHEIFFSNNVGNDTEDKFEIRRLKNGTETTIEEVKNGFATAVDEENQIAYFGGSSGIYRMNLATGEIAKIIHNQDIWDMFFRKHLYFITYPSQKLYKYTDTHGSKHKKKEPEHEKWIHEEIYQFAIDSDGDKFITNETGLFMIKNGTEHRILLEGEKVFRAIEINHKGEAHFCGKNGIYVAKKQERTLHEIAQVDHIFGLTFDSFGNIIYSNPLEIKKLVPSKCNIVDNTVSYVPIPIPT